MSDVLAPSTEPKELVSMTWFFSTKKTACLEQFFGDVGACFGAVLRIKTIFGFDAVMLCHQNQKRF